MAKEGVTGYLEVLKEEGQAIPGDNETLKPSLQLSAKRLKKTLVFDH